MKMSEVNPNTAELIENVIKETVRNNKSLFLYSQNGNLISWSTNRNDMPNVPKDAERFQKRNRYTVWYTVAL